MKRFTKILTMVLVVASLCMVTLPALAVSMTNATVGVPSGQTLNLRKTPSSSGTILYKPSSGTKITVDSSLTDATWITVTSYAQTCYGMRQFIDTSTVSNPTSANLFGSGNLAQSGTVKAAVFNLQWVLKRLGYNPGTIDGIFGSGTKSAVEAFQAAEGLTVDGIVEPATKTALINALP